MSTIILTAIVSLVVGGSFVYAYSRVVFWKGLYQENFSRYEEAFEASMDERSAREKAESDYKYLKDTINKFLSKPVMAVLTDQQMQTLAQSLMTYANASAKHPSDMN